MFIIMKKIHIFIISCLWAVVACSSGTPNNDDNGGETPTPTPPAPPVEYNELAEQNLLRAIQIADTAVAAHFTGTGMAMARYYNPYTKVRSSEKGSIWMYTAAVEAVNAILHALKTFQEQGHTELYNAHFSRYSDLLFSLYDNADYYLGTFQLTSYTRSKESNQQWSVYGVNRGNSKESAQVSGINNVYDDQQWLVRELLEAYKITNNLIYLMKAEYLTEYVLDGWDCTRDASGEEVGGIPWGPGYATKHACSNGPMVSPLVWLHELYKGKNDEIDHRYIDASDKKTRRTQRVKKSDYYLAFAEKIYAWQKKYLIQSDGVYADLRGGDNSKVNDTEVVDGQTYKKAIPLGGRSGEPLTYNSGTMLSGAADLYRATSASTYLVDLKKLADNTFSYFAKLGTTRPDYYTYNISGFNTWFNGVLMRAYVDAYPAYDEVDTYINSFQRNLDYAYEHFLYRGFLPTSLLVGWSTNNSNNNMEGMFTFTYAAEYAVLARYEMEK
jgi:predicted alpha-1,6-mannanase (GH76 family)